jgi:hypothetical protein
MKASKSFGQQLLQILHWAALGHHDRERRIGDFADGGEVLEGVVGLLAAQMFVD